MDVLSLWNADHLSGIGLQAPPSGGTTIQIQSRYSGFGADATNIVAAGRSGTLSRNNRNWLRLGGVSGTWQAAISLTPSLSQLKAGFPGVKRHYAGIRCYTTNIAAGGYLLSTVGDTAYTGLVAVNATEYFVEVVSDLITDVQTVYVNGVSHGTLNNTVQSGVRVGNWSATVSKMINATGYELLFNDYYAVVAYETEADIPDRLGKMLVKSTPITSVENDSRFTIVNNTNGVSITDLLNMPRNAWSTTYPAVLTDSLESKMKLNFQPPTNGDTVVGAVVSATAFRYETDQAAAYIDVNGTANPLGLVVPPLGTYNPKWRQAMIPTPEGGWSEAALGALDIRLYSKRTA